MALSAYMRTPKGQVAITCTPHLTNSKQERLIEQAFYDKYSGGGYEGPHYELELRQEESFWREYERKYHVHVNPDTKQKFVCWSGALPSIEVVRPVFELWAIGTIFTALNGCDFVEYNPSNRALFLTTMRDSFGIDLLD